MQIYISWMRKFSFKKFTKDVTESTLKKLFTWSSNQKISNIFKKSHFASEKHFNHYFATIIIYFIRFTKFYITIANKKSHMVLIIICSVISCNKLVCFVSFILLFNQIYECFIHKNILTDVIFIGEPRARAILKLKKHSNFSMG